MAGPIDSVRALWKDPKKRPWLIGGTGVAAGAGFLAMRRQQETTAAATEADPAAALEGDPTSLEAAAAGDPYAAGTLPALVYVGGDGQGGDPAFSEMDLSGVLAEIDGLREETGLAIDESVRAGTGGLRRRSRVQAARLKKAEQRNRQQQKRIRQQQKRIGRVERRVKRISKRRPPPRAKKKPARKRVRR